ncbi:winged helix DNA-binding domain-containing protein [Ilumatobacter sp.]|uniref:winged helix DNA-binding domain-containing protein n=1 Tax=Ilumatobacter sp. TaxID=1967498 RepID=UPI003AF97F29
MISVSDEDRRRRLAGRHLLLPETRIDSVPAIADAVVALHSSDPVTVFLSIGARSNDLTVRDVERALYDERSVIRHHAMRRTLWVTTPEVAEFAHAATTRKIAASERARSAKFVGDADWFDEAVRQVVDCVRASPEPLSTRQIGELLPELRREIVYGEGTRHEATGSAHTRAVLVAAFDGDVIRGRPAGTWIASQYAWGDTRRWREIDWRAYAEHGGAAALVETWLRRFGPGSLDDLVWWTGSTKTSIRSALAALDVTEVSSSSGEGYLMTDDLEPPAEVEPWAALLPGLDPTAMGWKQRDWYLDEVAAARVTDRFGNIGPTVWCDGRIVGGWAQRPDGQIATEFTDAVTREHRRLIDAEVERLQTFVGDARFRVRFPSPNQRDLLA